jgi:pyruvyltransferase
MAVRCFYWNVHRYGRLKTILPDFLDLKSKIFEYGNPGDVFNVDLVRFLYNRRIEYSEEGARLFLVGSTLHHISGGALVVGAGIKNQSHLPRYNGRLEVEFRGVRGPLTFRALRNCGYNLDKVKFMLDPGLLAPIIYSDLLPIPAIPGRVCFIPHFSEHLYYKRRWRDRRIELVSIDMPPRKLCETILKSELILTSSLHAIIFSHAFDRPVRFVTPRFYPDFFKYYDYFLSVGCPRSKPVDDPQSFFFSGIESSPFHVKVEIEDFDFPSEENLRHLGISTG